MKQEDKLKVVKESLSILEAQCSALGIDLTSIPPKYTQLAIRMFVEGITFWHKKQDYETN
jgi:hypothetical protein